MYYRFNSFQIDVPMEFNSTSQFNSMQLDEMRDGWLHCGSEKTLGIPPRCCVDIELNH